MSVGHALLEGVNILPDALFIPDIAVVDAAAAAEDPVAYDAEAVHLVGGTWWWRSSPRPRPAAGSTGCCSSRRITPRSA